MRARNRTMMAALLAGGVLLTGCSGSSGGDSTSESSADGAGGAKPPGGGYAQPDQESGEAAQQDRDEAGVAESGKDTKESPSRSMLSTFALDVDTASYSYATRQLRDGKMPQASAIRPEEFVNSFRQGYREPEGNGFSVSMDGARTTEDDWTLMRVGLATKSETPAERKRGPAALTFVVDVSGSMGEPGRLDLVKDSMRKMVGQLTARDSLSVVSFSDEARTELPMTSLGGEGRDAAREAIDDLEVRGNTNLGDGVRRGYQEAVEGKREGANNRVVLLSDALANTGSTQAEDILESIGKARKDHGITLFGVGVGSEYGDSLMEKLTNKGDGHTVYVSDQEEATRVFVHQLPRNLEVRARDAKAQVAFDEKTVRNFRLIGYENRRVADEDFRDDRVDGGEVGPGHSVTALYAVRLKEGASGNVATTTVRWLDPRTRKPSERSGSVSAGDLNIALWKDGSPHLRTAAVATYFAEALRQNGRQDHPRQPSAQPHQSDRPDSQGEGEEARPGQPAGGPGNQLPGDPGLGRLQEEAQRAAKQTENKAVDELAEAIGKARDLAG